MIIYVKFYLELYHTVLPYQSMLTNEITDWMVWLVHILCNSLSPSLSHSEYCTFKNYSCWIVMCESMLTFSTEPFKYKVYAAAGTPFNLNSHCGTFSLLDKRDVYLMGQHCHICLLKDHTAPSGRPSGDNMNIQICWQSSWTVNQKCHGWVSSIPASCLVCIIFKSQLRDWTTLIEGFHDCTLSRQMPHIRPWQVPSTSCSAHCLLIILHSMPYNLRY